MIQADPYRLARDIDGIGFKKADEIALGMGIPEISENRIRAAALLPAGRDGRGHGGLLPVPPGTDQ